MSTLVAWVSEFTPASCLPILAALLLVGLIYAVAGKRR